MKIARKGDAMKIDEYAPEASPIRRASPNSSSVVAPRISEPITNSEVMGMSAVIDVFNERISVWFNDRFTMSP